MDNQIETLLSQVSGRMDARFAATKALEFQSKISQAVADYLADGNWDLFLLTVENLTAGLSE